MSAVGSPARGPLAALWSRWWLALLLVLIGAGAGLAVGAQQGATFTAESRLIVGSDDLSSYQVLGFAQAAQNIASNYARYVDNSSTVSDTLRRDLGTKDNEVSMISASPIPQSSVVSVQVVASTKNTALAATRSVANTLVRLTATPSANSPSNLLKKFVAIARLAGAADEDVADLNNRIAKAVADKKSTDDLERKLSAAKLKAGTLDLQRTAASGRYQAAVASPASESQLRILQRASIVDESRVQTLQIFGSGGAIAGLVVALAISALLERRATRSPGKRRRDPNGASKPLETAPSATAY